MDLQNIVRRIYDQYLQKWSTDISLLPKARTYTSFKSYNDLDIEKYLTIVNNINHRNALIRFRCSSHNLMIEEGRFRKIERNNRLCKQCNMNVIEDEFHFLLVCPTFRQLRCQSLPNYYCHWPTKAKFKSLMTTKQNSTINKLAKFIYNAFKLRI